MSSIKQIQYHHMNCLYCGEKTTGELVAFDFIDIISHSISDKSPFECLKRLDLRLYLTIRDLSQEFHYDCDYNKATLFTLKVKHLKKQLEFIMNMPFDIISKVEVNSTLYNSIYKKLKVKDDHVDDLIILMRELSQASDNTKILSVPIRFKLDKDDLGHLIPVGIEYTINSKVYYSYKRVCPNCGHAYNMNSGKHEEYVIGMSGLARVGKTTYLASLVSQLTKSRVITLSDEANDDESYISFRDNIVNDYLQGLPVIKTNVDDMPTLYLPIRVIDRVYNFIFVDMPGEIYSTKDTDFIFNRRKIIRKANMIWCFIAPSMINNQYRNSNEDSKDYLTGLSHLTTTIESIYNRRRNSAVIITQGDLINAVNDNTMIFDDYLLDDHTIDYNKIIDNINVTKAYVNQLKTLQITLDELFKGYSLFTISSYGHDITKEKIEVIPSHIEVPFLWTLILLDLLKGKKNVVKKGLLKDKSKYVFIDNEDLYV